MQWLLKPFCEKEPLFSFNHFERVEEPFVLTVVHNGKQQDFEAQLLLSGYTYRFRVVFIDLNRNIFFKRDEEGHYRAPIAARGYGTGSR